MSSPTIIKLAVSPRKPSPSTSSIQRQVICPAEQSSPKEVLLLSTPKIGPSISNGEIRLEPFAAPTQLFPNNVANVTHEYSHAHPSLQDEENAKRAWHQRHVLLPFNIRGFGADIHRGEIGDLLHQIFPETSNVAEAFGCTHLIFQVDRLPEPPWPLTVGGLPFTIVTFDGTGRTFIFPRQILGSLTNSICNQGYDAMSLTDRTFRELVSEVHSYFKNNLTEIHPVELIFTAQHTIYIVLEDHVNLPSIPRARLPGRIAGFPVGYLNDRELHRPSWADLSAKREVEPQPTSGVVDNTVYDTLRPGVLISSKILKKHGHPATFSSTSGVLIQNRHGDRFMTGASHGISDDGNIWQGSQPEKYIGEAVVEIPFTDISLVKLRDDVKFVNQTFENQSGEAPAFCRLATSEDGFAFQNIHACQICFLNSPYTGSMEASIMAKSVKFETSTRPTQDRLRYVVYNWSYMGQMEGNDDRGPWKGFSASVSASELVEAGYTLVTE
ncbi:hypothetical protein F5Y14DRAFT_439771 [Nemania sp. NC0429]|nr:hypothetical protein F5Y14DRAFT_439771 [Nemania sp. NC0429]